MSLLDYFSKIYIINLPERTDRKKEIILELTKRGLEVDSGKIEFFSAIRPQNKQEFPSLGARGCFLSHLEILKKAEQENLEQILIIEDDLEFSKRLSEVEGLIVNHLQRTSWDIVHLGHPVKTTIGKDFSFTKSNEPVRCTHCIGFHSKVLPGLIQFLDSILKRPAGHHKGGPMHIDGAYSTFRMINPQTVTLLANPSLGNQRSSRSDVAKRKWFDRGKIPQWISYRLRQLKRFLVKLLNKDS